MIITHRTRVLLLSILSIFILSSCQSGRAVPTFTPLSTLSQRVTLSATVVPSLIITKEAKTFTSTSTSTSTLKPILSPSRTATQIPTSTSTLSPLSFDASKSFTRTPGNPASCPQSNPNVKPTFIDLLSIDSPDLEKPILDYLNSGGTWERILTALDWNNYLRGEYLFKGDLTGDNVPELVVSFRSLFVFGCKEGKYTTFLTVPVADDVEQRTPRIVGVTNMN
jgi:hypothetical protein